MRIGTLAALAPDWLASYAGVILLLGVLVNLGTGFATITHSLTIPSMRDDLAITYTQAGLLITVAGAVRMGASMAAGTLAPRYGSRYMIGVGTVVTGAAMILLGYSPDFFAALGATALMGLAGGAASTPMMGLVAPWFALQNRGLAAGLVAAGGSIAIVAAGLIVPWLIGQNSADGWRHTWYIFGAAVIVIGVVSLVFLRDRPRDPTSVAGQVPARAIRSAWPLTVFKNPSVWLLTYLGFCSGAASGVFNTFFGAYLIEDNGISLESAGQLLLLVGVLSIGSGIIWGSISDRLGRGGAFGVSFLILAISFGLYWLTPVMAALIVASALLGLTMRAAFTLCAAAAGDHVPVHFATTAFALISVGAGLGSTLSPMISGVIADTVGISWVFALGLGASLFGVAGSALLRTPRTSPPAGVNQHDTLTVILKPGPDQR